MERQLFFRSDVISVIAVCNNVNYNPDLTDECFYRMPDDFAFFLCSVAKWTWSGSEETVNSPLQCHDNMNISLFCLDDVCIFMSDVII